MAMEFVGDGMKNLTMDDRIVYVQPLRRGRCQDGLLWKSMISRWITCMPAVVSRSTASRAMRMLSYAS